MGLHGMCKAPRMINPDNLKRAPYPLNNHYLLLSTPNGGLANQRVLIQCDAKVVIKNCRTLDADVYFFTRVLFDKIGCSVGIKNKRFQKVDADSEVVRLAADQDLAAQGAFGVKVRTKCEFDRRAGERHH